MGWVYAVARKAHAGFALEQFLQDNQLSPQEFLIPRSIRADNAGELVGPQSTFATLCREFRIQIETVPAHSSILNGVVERANRSLLQVMRASLLHSGVPVKNWVYCAKYARSILNLVPKHDDRVLDGEAGVRFVSPFEAWTDERPPIDHFRVWGCKCYVRSVDLESKHLSPRAKTCIFLGLASKPGCYIVRSVETGRLLVTRDCVFDEASFPAFASADPSPASFAAYLDRVAELTVAEDEGYDEHVPADDSGEGASFESLSDDSDDESDDIVWEPSHAPDPEIDNGSESDNEDELMSHDEEPAAPARPRRAARDRCATGPQGFLFNPARNAARPQLGGEKDYAAYFLPVSKGRSARTRKSSRQTMKTAKKRAIRAVMCDTEPPADCDPSFKKAINDRVHGEKWKAALDEEWSNLFNSGAFRWIKRTDPDFDRSIRPLPCHIIAKFKALTNRYKMRVVINGNFQEEGSYGETYAATIASALVRLVLCIGVHCGFDIRVVDIKSAFLYSDLPPGTTIYLHPPEHLKRPGHLIKLEKSCYGLKQAPRLFNDLLHKVLREYGLEQSSHDASLFFSIKRKLYVAQHVDDLTITGPDAELDAFTTFLKKKFDLSTEDSITNILGMDVDFNREIGLLRLNQHAKVKDLLKSMDKYLVGLRGKNIPVRADKRLQKPSQEELQCVRDQLERDHGKHWEKNVMPFRSIVGSVLYLSTMTRPDLTFAMSYLTRFMSCFTSEHFAEAVRVLQYLLYKPKVELEISREKLKNFTLTAYCDSDWAGEPDERKSVSGYVVYLGKVPLLWKSQLQGKTALSSGEAEFVALSETVRQVLTFRYVLDELGFGDHVQTS